MMSLKGGGSSGDAWPRITVVCISSHVQRLMRDAVVFSLVVGNARAQTRHPAAASPGARAVSHAKTRTTYRGVNRALVQTGAHGHTHVSLDDVNIADAVGAWLADEAAATTKFGDINSWDVSGVTDMSYLFYKAASFNGDVSSWDVSSVADMSYPFLSGLGVQR
jgi:surface protein